jgi:hypothetical protein
VSLCPSSKLPPAAPSPATADVGAGSDGLFAFKEQATHTQGTRPSVRKKHLIQNELCRENDASVTAA